MAVSPLTPNEAMALSPHEQAAIDELTAGVNAQLRGHDGGESCVPGAMFADYSERIVRRVLAAFSGVGWDYSRRTADADGSIDYVFTVKAQPDGTGRE